MESPSWEELAQEELDGKAKPPGSLGLLELWAKKLSVLQRTLTPKITASRLIVFAADHGITLSTPGVSAYPRQVSAAIFRGIALGGAASAVLCAANGCSLNLVDVGLDADVRDVSASQTSPHITVTHEKIRNGSGDMSVGPAMTPEQMESAMTVGARAVERAVLEHTGEGKVASTLILCIGELGIGNTTSASALTSAVTGKQPEEVCGRGTGLDNEGVCRKVDVVLRSLAVNADLIALGPLSALRAVGGLEIAAMVGAYLKSAELRIPIIVDGFISGSAALIALRTNGKLSRCLFWAHRSDEKGSATLLSAAAEAGNDGNTQSQLERPALDMGLRLGEGTGAVLAVPLLRSAAAMMSDMISLNDLQQG